MKKMTSIFKRTDFHLVPDKFYINKLNIRNEYSALINLIYENSFINLYYVICPIYDTNTNKDINQNIRSPFDDFNKDCIKLFS